MPHCSPKQLFWWGALLLLLSYAALAIPESLWVDELHTSWTVAGRWNDVAERAAAGNQLPLYFQLLWWLVQMGGQSEWLLRSPSLVAWGVALAVAIGIVRNSVWRASLTEVGLGRQKHCQGLSATSGTATGPGLFGKWSLTDQAAIVVLAFIGLDRLQVFYATEARPYALLQLVTLLGWIAVFAAHRAPPGHRARGARDSNALDSRNTVAVPSRGVHHVAVLCWGMCAATAIHLHLTALLTVAGQVLALMWLAARGQDAKRNILWNSLVVVLIALTVFPTIGTASHVWQIRGQWSVFAGDASPTNVLTQLPVLPWLIPVALAWMGIGASHKWIVWTRRKNETSDPDGDRQSGSSAHWMPPGVGQWLFAGSWPVVAAWVLTAARIAPLAHNRYMLTASIPLAIAAAAWCTRLRNHWIRLAVVSTSVLWLLVSQGTVHVWTSGQLIGWLRGEQWRGAARWVTSQWQSGDHLACWSGLIEADRVRAPVRGAMREYLSYPLRGIYRVQAVGTTETVDPIPLVGPPRQWLVQWDAEGVTEGRVWIIFRGSRPALADNLDRLANAAKRQGWQVRTALPPKGMGRISAACVWVSK